MNQWKSIKGYNGKYLISKDGSVQCTKYKRIDGRHFPSKILKPQRNRTGYEYYTLYHNKKSTIHFGHRLVAIHYIPNPKKLEQVNHKDGKKRHNHYSNLEWCTASENMKHAVRTGLRITVTNGAFKKGGKPWNAGKKTGQIPWNYIKDRSCSTAGCKGAYFCRGMCQKCHRRSRYLRKENNLLPEASLSPSEQ